LLELKAAGAVRGGLQPFDLSAPPSQAIMVSGATRGVDEEIFSQLMGKDQCGKNVFDKSMESFLHDQQQLAEKCLSLLL